MRLRTAIAALTLSILVACVAPAGTLAGETKPASTLSVLDRPATARDKLPRRLRASLKSFAQRVGTNLDDARQTVDGVWLIPARDDVCLLVEDAHGIASTCAPRAQGATRGTWITGPGPRRGQRAMAGFVGDGVSRVRLTFADGRSKTYPVADNGFRAGPVRAGTGVKVTFE